MTHHHIPTSHHHQQQPPSTSHNHRNHHHNHHSPPSSQNHHQLRYEPSLPPPFNDLNLTPPPSYTNQRRRNQQHYHPYSTTSSSSSASIRGCCCCLILLFSFLALLALTIVLVIVLAVKPKKPEFDLQQVGVQYINLAGFTPPNGPSTASLSLAIRMLFTAKNDNKVGIKYGVSTFNIMYRGIPLGRGTVPGFYQPAHSLRQVQTIVKVDRVNLLQADAADLVRDALNNDRVELRIMGDVNAKIRILGLTSPAVQVTSFPSFFFYFLEICFQGFWRLELIL